MKIYTKTGDAGKTGLFGGERVGKDHPRIRVYGGIDELNAILGMALAEGAAGLPEPLRGALARIQAELFQLGGELATPAGKKLAFRPVDEEAVERLEREIDAMEGDLAPLRTFILPSGTRAATALHLARTVCRRAERDLVTLMESDGGAELIRPEALRYLNRLSDALFVAARWVNHRAGATETPWTAPK